MIWGIDKKGGKVVRESSQAKPNQKTHNNTNDFNINIVFTLVLGIIIIEKYRWNG